jgi:sulfatase maturation enzyme AslB (radical SAM superfamily)
MHYNDNFAEQLKEYIPHLEELRFNGGEPFLHKIVHKICMLVSEINPNLQINMATNGMVYNKRVKEILDKCNIHMNISIDGFTKETYEKIRVNSDWDTLMKNFKIFWKYLIKKNCAPSVMVNPMRNNWWEMKEAVRFANEYKSHLWYNTVHHPSHLALHNLSIEELKDIHRQLKKDLRKLEEENKNYNSSNTSEDYLDKRKANIGKFQMFVNNQIVGWIADHEKVL